MMITFLLLSVSILLLLPSIRFQHAVLMANAFSHPLPRCKRNISSALLGTTSMTVLEAENLLNAINVVRHEVRNPNASSMLLLKWNKDLSLLAQRSIEKCPSPLLPLPLNPDRTNVNGFAYIGQNLVQYDTATHGTNALYAITFWNESKRYYTYERNCNADAARRAGRSCGSCSGPASLGGGNACNSYLQMIWADTKEVGCAVAVCNQNSSSSSSGGRMTYVSCLFGPTGNLAGEQPYVATAPGIGGPEGCQFSAPSSAPPGGGNDDDDATWQRPLIGGGIGLFALSGGGFLYFRFGRKRPTSAGQAGKKSRLGSHDRGRNDVSLHNDGTTLAPPHQPLHAEPLMERSANLLDDDTAGPPSHVVSTNSITHTNGYSFQDL